MNLIQLAKSGIIKSKQEILGIMDYVQKQLTESNVAHPDLRPTNVIKKGSKYYLIDWVPGKFKPFDYNKLDSYFDSLKSN